MDTTAGGGAQRAPTARSGRAPAATIGDRVVPGLVCVLVPAHNEAAGIERTLDSLLAQTYPHIHVVVIADNCTDATPNLAGRYLGERVTLLRTVNNVDRKAGGMNMAVDYVAQRDQAPEFVVTMDADSRFEPEFVERAVNVLRNRPELGAVTGVLLGERDVGRTPWQRFLCWLQEVEFSRYASARPTRNVFTLSGAGSVYRTEALLAIKTVHGGLVFERGSRVEDVTSTMHLRQLGWRVTANEYLRVWTDVMPTARAIVDQRVGWILGSMGEARKLGLHRYTGTVVGRLTVAVLAQLLWFGQLVAVVTIAAMHGLHLTRWDVVLFAAIGLYNGFHARRLGIRSALACATNVPMLLYWPFVVTYVFKSVALFAAGHRATW